MPSARPSPDRYVPYASGCAANAGAQYRAVETPLLARYRAVAYPDQMSDAARQDDQMPHGTSLLARDLTTDELSDAPVLESLDDLLIEGLTDDEDDAFAAAINT